MARDDLSFSPPEIEVTVGEVVTFEISNQGATAHEFLLGDQATQDEYAASTQERVDEPPQGALHGVTVAPGQTEQVTWRFTRAGEFVAGCHLPGHYSAGMYVDIRVGANRT